MSIDLSVMPKLGFGLMRLPEKDGVIDHEHVCRMVDKYMEAGMNYFDTAYVYHGGKSEVAARQAANGLSRERKSKGFRSFLCDFIRFFPYAAFFSIQNMV